MGQTTFVINYRNRGLDLKIGFTSDAADLRKGAKIMDTVCF